jgi:Gas vesicle synthesis protein GvpL/GvpF
VTETATSTAWYVYAVVGPATPELRRAVEGRDLRLQGEGELAAVAAPVPLSEFGEDVLPERLNDRVWLEEKARAHEDVLLRLLEQTTVVPFRFGSIYRDLEAVAEMLTRRRESFARALEAVRGRVELGVKAWRLEDPAGDAPPPTSGRAYLERRLDERRRATEASAAIDAALRDAHMRFLALAEDGVLNRPQPRELTGRTDEMVLNAAYLVAAGDTSLVAEVAAVDDRFRELGLAFEVTGPWPPHNFVDPEGET